jgi:hypothetical protein
MYRKQFLLTKNKDDFQNLSKVQSIGDYHLHLGLDSEHCFVINGNNEFHLLGSLYDFEHPEFSNKQILETISQAQNIEDVTKISDDYCGLFVLIVKLNDEIFLFNDAASQKEVYYDDEFTSFGTQPKLIGVAVDLLEHTDKDAVEYYSSGIFKARRLFVGNATHKRNIFHLLPNHLLNIKEKRNQRFFPVEALENKPLESVAQESSRMIKGFVTAVAKRNKIKMPVTGGYDSRILFLASLEVDCEYYVTQMPHMDKSHHDISVPESLTNYYNKEFIIEDESAYTEGLLNDDYNHDLDFPRQKDAYRVNDGATFLTGNVSEIARNYHGYHSNATAEDLCFISGNWKLDFATKQYSNWLKEKPIFTKYGYHYLDMFYWEDKMGNWSAKGKTENFALGRDIIIPYNSRTLLKLLLSTKRNKRDSHFNTLYDLLIKELSGNDKNIMKIPINPSKKQSIIRLMKFWRLYNLYRHIGVKTRRLRV